MLTVAESCTGGGMSEVLTAIAGSSRWFVGGVIAYANSIKTDWLGVLPTTLAGFGAVSNATAGEMACGALYRCGANLAVSITGIAGPEGGTVEKPVGTVCFGFATSEKIETETKHFHGDRQSVRKQAVAYALQRAIQIAGGKLPEHSGPDWLGEVIALHRFFQDWYSGAIPKSEATLNRIRQVWRHDFRLVAPDGSVHSAGHYLDCLPEQHGSLPGLVISIKSPQVVWRESGNCMVRYRERHSDEKPSRICTALLAAEPTAPLGVIWRHLHETTSSAF